MQETSSAFRKQSGQNLWVRNSENFPVVLCIEPWANEIQLLTGNDYHVIFEGPEGEFPAVEWGKNRITLYGWSGSVAHVFLAGKEVLSCANPVPAMPKR